MLTSGSLLFKSAWRPSNPNLPLPRRPLLLSKRILSLYASSWLTWFLLACSIICPYVYFSIARPCVRCFDFEASFTQSDGQALGLTDPTLAGNADYSMVLPLNRSNCNTTALAPPSDVTSLLSPAYLNSPRATELGEGPVMLTPTLKRAAQPSATGGRCLAELVQAAERDGRMLLQHAGGWIICHGAAPPSAP